MAYDIGNLVRVRGSFAAVGTGAPVDPATVKVWYQKPDDVETTWEYGIDPEVEKDAVGEYHADIPVDQGGTWFYRFEGTGTGKAASEDSFDVNRSEFY